MGHTRTRIVNVDDVVSNLVGTRSEIEKKITTKFVISISLSFCVNIKNAKHIVKIIYLCSKQV